MRKIFLFISFLLIVFILFGGYMLMKGKRDGELKQIEEKRVEQELGVLEEAVTEFVVTAQEYSFSFSPKEVSLSAGQKVRITFVNNGQMEHDFVFDELSLRTKVLGPGETGVLEFTIPKNSSLTYYCSVANHRSLGMEGSIRIN